MLKIRLKYYIITKVKKELKKKQVLQGKTKFILEGKGNEK